MEPKKILEHIKSRLGKDSQSRERTQKLGIVIKEYQRIQALPRFKQDQTVLFGHPFKIVDAVSFLGSLHEIFGSEIYKFRTSRKPVTIIDCGANIGLATLYFKMKYPNAIVTAFEPDPNIFEVMKYNVTSFGYDDVIVRNEAVSNLDSFVPFHLEGGHSGMIVETGNTKDVVQIKAVRLKNVLEEFDKITFLKIDIEGHESDVIPDIAAQLKKVEFLFLEYHSFIDADQKLTDILSIIKEAGLRYYIKEAANKPFPFIDREIFLKMDCLVNIFCYRD